VGGRGYPKSTYHVMSAIFQLSSFITNNKKIIYHKENISLPNNELRKTKTTNNQSGTEHKFLSDFVLYVSTVIELSEKLLTILLNLRYTRKIFIKGFRTQLREEDIYEVLPSYESKKLGNKLERIYKRQKEQQVFSMLSFLWKSFGLQFFIIITTLLIRFIIMYFY
jgi:hypothetical protein